MNHYRLLTIITLCLLASHATAQDTSKFRLLHFTSSHTSFPDTHRARGYVYDSVLYTFPGHYNDSSVLLVIPKHFESTQKVDLVFWFHGWNNCIDTAVEFYRLAEQFIDSKRNAILVLSETARNAPDSYGGRLEQPGIFKSLVNDVLDELKSRNLVPSKAVPGNILLCGHSGAFLVIADILQNGHMPVSEVFLFDALYSQVDKFLTWIIRDQSHHFIHWYTNKGGGTDIMSDTM
ncbi:MAG: hypothetical protein M3N30_04040, partial [Bacteroidota bacterium]|nr:hypothetical protein [Bacteroidota bacterium]